MAAPKTIVVALADDHQLVRNSIAHLVETFPRCMVLFQADNGEEVLKNIKNKRAKLPDILLLDISMPVMDGFETVTVLSKLYPTIKVIALTMNTSEQSVVKMLRKGAKGFLSKNTPAPELQKAIETVFDKGFYLPEEFSWKLVNSISDMSETPAEPSELSDKEKEFLRFNCTDLSTEGIAKKMFISARTVEGYRVGLYEKLKVRTRMGLAFYAIQNGIVKAIDEDIK
jgi:DNA-binding NarL/FixJ family response regulator